MSGHSKWSSIKHKKAAVDAKRGKIFSKLAKEIAVAAKIGGGDPGANARLRTVLAQARSANMPASNVEKAIKKGTGELPGVSYEEASYECYGPGGVAILMTALTDNKNRTVAELRHIIDKHNGRMAGAGSVAWLFEKKGLIAVSRSAMSEDDLLEAALEAGAEDISTDDEDSYEIYAAPKEFTAVKEQLEAKQVPIETAALTMIPKSTVKLSGKEAKQTLTLVELLEDHDDVQEVHANFDIPNEILAEIAGEQMRVIGIDPGTAVTGYGVVESRGNSLEAVTYGVIRTRSGLPAAERLEKIHNGLKEIIAEHKPQVASIEKLFVSKNPAAALAVGQARGVSMLAAVSSGLEVAEFSPAEVKQAVVGYGKADKRQVQEMVKVLLGLSELPRPDDAADGLALAICRLHMAPIKED